MTEDEWWKWYQVIRNEVTNTIESFYTWLDINTYVGKNDLALRKMNQNPTFWIICMHSLQTNFFITMGRVFDKNSDSYSIQKLMEQMINHPEFFSRSALGRRKHSLTNGPAPSWLAAYLLDAWAPTAGDLKQFKDELIPTIAKYEAVYKPIRHKMFAHRDIRVDVKALLGTSLIADVEHILYSLHDIVEAIWDLYFNGTKPSLGVRQYDYKKRIDTTTANVIIKLTS